MENSIKYQIVSKNPQSHIQICYIIGSTGAEILSYEIPEESQSKFYSLIIAEGTPDSLYHITEITSAEVEIIH